MRRLVLGLAASAAASCAQAGEAWIGVFGHDVPVGIADCCFEHGTDIQVGLRTNRLSPLERFGDLRLYALGSANTGAGVGFAAAGVAWRWRLGRTALYLQPGLGGAVQFGSDAKRQLTPDKLYLGSRLLFEPELSLGWSPAERWSLEASYVHLSHAQLAGRQNPGLDEVGMRAVYRFGGGPSR